MKSLQIIIYNNDVELGKADYMCLHEGDNGEQLLKFENLVLEHPHGNTALEITVLYNGYECISLDVYIKRKLLNDVDDIFEVTIENDFYNQKVVDILRNWDDGGDWSWRMMKEEEKRAWLIACLYAKGLPEYLPDRDSFVIESSAICTRADFYCLIGEEFFGVQGYFGQDLDGLDDCFVGMKNRGEQRRVLVLNDYSTLKQRLGEKYVSTMVEIFRSRNFRVELKN